jgi:hypothetical protein
MSLTSFCGKVAIAVSCLIVLIFVGLLILAGICLGIGAYESATNPNATHDMQQEYQNLSQQIDTGSGQVQHVQPFTTRYWPEETPIQINKTGV